MRRLVVSLYGGLAAALVVVFVAGPPLLTCWTGVGPPPEPATSQCVVDKWNALSPFDRLQLEQPLLTLAIVVLLGFAVTYLLIGAVRRASSPPM